MAIDKNYIENIELTKKKGKFYDAEEVDDELAIIDTGVKELYEDYEKVVFENTEIKKKVNEYADKGIEFKNNYFSAKKEIEKLEKELEEEKNNHSAEVINIAAKQSYETEIENLRQKLQRSESKNKELDVEITRRIKSSLDEKNKEILRLTEELKQRDKEMDEYRKYDFEASKMIRTVQLYVEEQKQIADEKREKEFSKIAEEKEFLLKEIEEITTTRDELFNKVYKEIIDAEKTIAAHGITRKDLSDNEIEDDEILEEDDEVLEEDDEILENEQNKNEADIDDDVDVKVDISENNNDEDKTIEAEEKAEEKEKNKEAKEKDNHKPELSSMLNWDINSVK